MAGKDAEACAREKSMAKVYVEAKKEKKKGCSKRKMNTPFADRAFPFGASIT
jgi:hypothetical protein